jgi:hypothetical protein
VHALQAWLVFPPVQIYFFGHSSSHLEQTKLSPGSLSKKLKSPSPIADSPVSSAAGDCDTRAVVLGGGVAVASTTAKFAGGVMDPAPPSAMMLVPYAC